MSRATVYFSMLMWAVLGLIAFFATRQLVAQAYPHWHVAARMASGLLAFNMVYWLRAYARRGGWAMASYAPDDSGRS